MLNFKQHSKIKIVISLIMVMVLTVGFTFNQISAEYSARDNSDFELAAEFLDKQYFLVEGDISEDNITRGEMAFYAAGLYSANPGGFYQTKLVELTNTRGGPIAFGDGTVIQEGETYEMPTTDFDNKDYEKSIEKCIEEKIMNADWFAKPDATVTLKDAVQALIHALRYEKSDDYIAKGLTKEMKLLGEHAVFPFKGVSADKVLTKNDALMLLYNCMLSEYAVEVESTRGELVFNDETGRYDMKSEKFKSVMNMFGMYVATPITTSSAYTVDGKKISFDSYNIGGNNYLKIRDIAYALNGTAKQFNIEITENYEDEYGGTVLGVMNLIPGKPYTAIGGEMAEQGRDTMTAFQGYSQACRLAEDREDNYGGYWNQFRTFMVNGEEYFKLRDVAELLGFSVEWDSAKNSIAIDTSKPYTAE